MQILFDLVQSLSREEKRLYQLHKREGRIQHIYEAYLKALRFTKALDQDTYQEHFSDVSRAFYSMQKRALMDNILTVLLEYSNNQHPGYQFNRLYGRAKVLLERRMGEAAVQYGEEALERAHAASAAEAAMGAVRLQQQALVLSKNPSLKLYEQLTQLEAELAERSEKQKVLERCLNLLTLLRINTDGDDAEQIAEKATAFIQPVHDMAMAEDQYELQMGRLACLELYHDLVGKAESYHRTLSAYVAKHVTPTSGLPRLQQYELINRHLKSGLAVGDFLMLTGAIYRLNKEAESLPESIQAAFLPDYLEVSALFYFYENDIPASLAQLAKAQQLMGVDHAQQLRVLFYRFAILLAANLPTQGLEEIENCLQRVPELADNGLLYVLEVLFHLDLDPTGTEATLLIERHRNTLRKRKSGRHLLEILATIEQFVEKRKYRPKPIQVFPSDWEDILRIDLWLQAKAQGSFYYNLLTQRWHARRKVF